MKNSLIMKTKNIAACETRINANFRANDEQNQPELTQHISIGRATTRVINFIVFADINAQLIWINWINGDKIVLIIFVWRYQHARVETLPLNFSSLMYEFWKAPFCLCFVVYEEKFYKSDCQIFLFLISRWGLSMTNATKPLRLWKVSLKSLKTRSWWTISPLLITFTSEFHFDTSSSDSEALTAAIEEQGDVIEWVCAQQKIIAYKIKVARTSPRAAVENESVRFNLTQQRIYFDELQIK